MSDDERTRSGYLRIRCTPAQRAEIGARATAAGFASVSAWVLHMTLGASDLGPWEVLFGGTQISTHYKRERADKAVADLVRRGAKLEEITVRPVGRSEETP